MKKRMITVTKTECDVGHVDIYVKKKLLQKKRKTNNLGNNVTYLCSCQILCHYEVQKLEV